MPSSSNITVPYVSAIINSLSPTSALDIGIGMGKFGFLFRESCEWATIMLEGKITHVSKEHWHSRLDGIEVCSKYITPLQEYLYDKIHIGYAQEVAANLHDYDLIHMGDVIEHIEKSDAQKLLDILFQKARLGVLVITPVGEYHQEGVEGNPYEEHQSVWSPADFHRFPFVWSRKVGKSQWIIFISRKRYWLSDPIRNGGTQVHHMKINARKQRIKNICNLLVGEKGLNYMIRIKRYCEGWRGNR